VIALARGAAVMVSGDTGPTHLASASARRSSASTGDAAVAQRPAVAGRAIVTRDAICQCHHLRRCRMSRMCLLDIEVAEVVDTVERRLSAGRSRV
jgi:ADP-heptose:LPS heptosyltransferase